ncbi:WbqC family protein [Actinomadura sp. ATCC 31491]|uniref:WbqC family protein n=1 Tax=Actinomadura luzonensis TaxID=2805427 RepID=A0ABT0FPG4_9ACTN|nr:WbqC family protein [Actinomadura luzonensis]MCK2214038.1 WbqC family protein [Actinomadura luzonensis]
MTPTRLFSAPDSTAGSCRPESPYGEVCAIHQPNLFPRLATLAKLFTADYWIVLDDVQFARRDYQHRARLASFDGSREPQWLSIATHLPHGRSTSIRGARLADPIRCRRRVAQLLADHYGHSAHWQAFKRQLEPLLAEFERTDRLADVTELSTRLLLEEVEWPGQILHSSDLLARGERSQRLADLAWLTGATTYLCGTGGMRYLDPTAFRVHSIEVLPFQAPTSGVWASAREVSAVHALMLVGPYALRRELEVLRGRIQNNGSDRFRDVRSTS